MLTAKESWRNLFLLGFSFSDVRRVLLFEIYASNSFKNPHHIAWPGVFEFSRATMFTSPVLVVLCFVCIPLCSPFVHRECRVFLGTWRLHAFLGRI